MLAGVIQLFLVSFGLMYFVALAAGGLSVLAQSRRHRPTGPSGSRVPGQSAHRITRSGRRRKGRASRLGGRILRHLTTADQPVRRLAAGAGAYHVYYLVPCLNEELVIGATIASLLADPQARVVVVDDASDDRTAELAGAAGPGRVLIVGRALPAARKGKGPALNAGFAVIQADVERRTLAPEKTIVCVMDADGRLSAGALHAVLPLFDDPEVGGVQLAVRIRNGADGLLPRMQDALFLGLSAAFQLARVHCGTVSLGGNGQFTRLSALLELERDPWRKCLTEDLDLSIALSVEGWQITTTPAAFVSQQGVTTVAALFHQWTRWYQGHMESIRWLPRLWSSRRLSHLGVLEISLFLMVPWLLVLPWSILFHYTLYVMIRRTADWYTVAAMGTDRFQHLATLALWYMLSFAPNWIVGYLYYRQDRRIGLVRGILTGHLLLAANYVAYAAAWRALYRMVRGQRSWTKTARNREADGVARPAAAVARPATSVVPGPRVTQPASGLRQPGPDGLPVGSAERELAGSS